MKTGPGFKLSKSTKRILATMTGDMYGVYKRMMIDAEVAETFMKSPTLKYYWINEYKPKLSGPASRAYMEKNFNL